MAKRVKHLRRPRGQWKPERAHAFCMARMGEIETILLEIAHAYDGIDQTVVYECDRLRDEQLPALGRTLDEALEEGRSQ